MSQTSKATADDTAVASPINRVMDVPFQALWGNESRQLALLSGIPASGKSTLGLQLRQAGFDYHNADSIRAELYGDEAILGDTKTVFGILNERLKVSLAAGRNAVVDVTNITRRSRREFIDMGKEYGYSNPTIFMMDTSVNMSLARNKARKRQVPEHVIMSMVSGVLRGGLPAADEGRVFFLRPTETDRRYTVMSPEAVRAEQPLPGVHAADLPLSRLAALTAGRAQPKEKFDIVGDVHGCFSELVALIAKLGHDLRFERSRRGAIRVVRFIPKDGRRLAFVGDLVDRGPASDKVLALVRWLVNHGHAIVARGNHDDRLYKYLAGKPERVAGSLRGTVAQLRSRSLKFRRKVKAFLAALPLTVESESLVLVHAAYRQGLSGEEYRKLSLYGEVCDTVRDNKKRHIRLTRWEDEYAGTKTIVRGHDSLRNPALKLTKNGGWVVNIDTGCCFGNALTAMRFPEMYLVSVPAERVHWKPDFQLP